MPGLGGGDDGGVGGEREVNPGVGHQVGGELVQVHVEGSLEPQRGGDGGDDLGNQLVELPVTWALHVQLVPADVEQRVVVYQEGHVGVLHGREGGEDGVVGLNHGGGGGGGRVNREVQLGLPGVLQAQSFLQQRGKPGASASSEAVENKETLRAAGILHVLPDPVHHAIQDLLPHGVVTSGEVVGGVLLARDETVRVPKRLVGPGPQLLQTTIEIDSQY